MGIDMKSMEFNISDDNIIDKNQYIKTPKIDDGSEIEEALKYFESIAPKKNSTTDK
mgnify:CR=1 FL=1